VDDLLRVDGQEATRRSARRRIDGEEDASPAATPLALELAGQADASSLSKEGFGGFVDPDARLGRFFPFSTLGSEVGAFLR